jgi:hypothetical protein
LASFRLCNISWNTARRPIKNATADGQSLWDVLSWPSVIYDPDEESVVEMTALLRVMVLRGAPPIEVVAIIMLPEHAMVEDEGARLRARLPAYLERRRAILGPILDENCPLIAPLQDLVHGYDEPTTADELWATGLGAAP